MQNMDQVRMCWSSGFVNRWHTNTDPRLRNSHDTNDAHSCRVAKLTYMLACLSPTVRDDMDLVMALETAIWHDAPEKLTGDIGYECKRLHPPVRPMLRKLDQFYWDQVGIRPMNDTKEDGLVHMCDQIDALLFCKTMAPDLWLRRDWQNHTAYVLILAHELGFREHIDALIHGETAL